MGNLLTVIVSAITEEIINKIKSNGYHTYNIDYENSFTIDGIRSNPKCKTILKKTSICAEELFKIDNVSMDDNNRLIVNLKIPKTVINIGKAAFSCTDPEFSCAGKGWIQILDSYFTLTLSMNMLNGFKLEEATIKPKLSEIKSDIKLLVNKKDCSGLANSVLRSENPVMLNFILDFVFKSQEESIKEFINNFLQEMQRRGFSELNALSLTHSPCQAVEGICV